MDDVISLQAVHKSFGRSKALDGLSFGAKRGRVVGFLGVNGAGKTTAMRLLAGLIRAESGLVTVLGRDAWTLSPEDRRRIGYLSEKDFPFPRMTFELAARFTSRFFENQ